MNTTNIHQKLQSDYWSENDANNDLLPKIEHGHIL